MTWLFGLNAVTRVGANRDFNSMVNYHNINDAAEILIEWFMCDKWTEHINFNHFAYCAIVLLRDSSLID